MNIVRWILQWERQRGALIEKSKGPWHRNVVILKFNWIIFFGGGGEDEDKRVVELVFYFYYSKLPFLDI